MTALVPTTGIDPTLAAVAQEIQAHLAFRARDGQACLKHAAQAQAAYLQAGTLARKDEGRSRITKNPADNGRFMVPSLRNMLAQPKSTITFRRLMDEGAIVICNLAKGSLGESTAHLLGALITTSLAQAALSRADTPAAERRVFHLYADEFQSFATESFGLILSEARKYALTLTIGHQYLDQLPFSLRAAVFGNAGSIVRPD